MSESDDTEILMHQGNEPRLLADVPTEMRSRMIAQGLYRIKLFYPVFRAYEAPQGFLCHEDACHALFYYAVTARRVYEDVIQGHAIEYEGDVSAVANFKQMLDSIANLYGIPLLEIVKHWRCVDMQFDNMRSPQSQLPMPIPRLPNEERYRFNSIPEIKLQ